jgi:hypothetical protein
MTQPNNPYARPINATRPDAVLQSEHYGQRATDKRRSHETKGREVSPAGRFQSGVTAVPAWPDAEPAPTKPKTKRGPKADKVIVDEQPAPITEDDLFG